MFWDNLISTANKANAQACIHANIYPDQQCAKGKQLLKISINSWDDQIKKTKSAAPQTKTNPPISNQLKTSKNAKKE